MTTKATPRQCLIALNSGVDLGRDSICRLALCLDEWAWSSQSSVSLQQQLQVPAAALDKARRLIRDAVRLAERETARARRAASQIVTFDEMTYPESLRQLELPPPVLYCRGQLPCDPGVAIVGSRRASPVGTETAEMFGRELAARGLAVISGFARGIDHAAHRGALSSADGTTVAILGCGIDVDYPRRRNSIREAIASRGALVSEFPLGTRPAKLNFPIRNRIIAALSFGTLVVEGARHSGSLITARLAVELGRDVYAVPGSIYDPLAAGTNALIRDGALLVSHPEDIIEALPIAVRSRLSSPVRCPLPAPDVAAPLADVLALLPPGRTCTAEEVAATADRPLHEVLGVLVELEITGAVKRFPGAHYCRRP